MKKINYNHYLLYICIIHFLFLISNCNCHEDNYYSCNHRIYSENLLLSQNEHYRLCDLLLRKDRFTIYITEKKQFKYDSDYNKESEQFFKEHCIYNTIPCHSDFSISIFTNAKKLRITAGKTASNKLSKNQWETITQAMISKLKRGDYYDAIEDGINWLDQSAPYDSSIDFPKHGDNDNNHNKKSSFGFGSFVLFILLPCCGCGALWYFYYYKPKMELNANADSNNNNPQLNSNLITPNVLNTNSMKDIIHFHLNYLLELHKQIKSQMPPIINTNKCMICQQSIHYTGSNQYIEMIQINEQQQQQYQQPNQYLNQIQDTVNTRFGCLHLYHSSCLNKYNLTKCIMCYQSSTKATEVIPNNYDTHIIEEHHITSLIKNFALVYSPQDLRDYSSSYDSEFNQINQTLIPELSSLWQISNNNNYMNSYTPPAKY